MSKFITYYNLCPIPEPKDFLGISPDKEDGNIITTLGKNIIIIIKISTQKQIKSWSVLEKLSSKVVYDKKTKKYVAVFANKSLRCWDENTIDINKCKKLKFQKCIADLVISDNDTYVLYTDGSCELLAVAIESRKEDIATTNSQQFELSSSLKFTNASVQCLPNDKQILTYFERNSKSGEYHLVRISLNADDNTRKRFNLNRENLNVAGAAVITGDTAPMLLTIWSDKRIFLLSLADDSTPDRSPGSFVSMLTPLNVDTPLSVVGISKHFVAIYGANHGQEGASLILYNTQYKVIKTKQFFKVFFNFSQLWSIDDHILLAMGQNLSVVKYRVLKEVLSELVGTQLVNEYQTAVEDDHINEEDLMEECFQYTDEIGGFTKQKTAEKTIPLVADGLSVAFINSNKFDKELSALQRLNLHVDVIEVDQPLEDVQICLMSNYNDDGFICPEIQLIARQLEKVGASEHEITEKLLMVLMKAQLLPDIGVCLRRYNNISEKILSKTLSFLLKRFKPEEQTNSTPQLINGANVEHMEVELNMQNDTTPYPDLDLLADKYPRKCTPSEVTDILNILLACSFDTETIALHIRQDIEYSHVILILQHLYNMLTAPQSPWLIEERPSIFSSSCYYEIQLLRWFGVFLQSHFQKLALSKDVDLVELLYKWHELFQSYKREIDCLSDVAALLYNIVERKNLLKEKSSSKWYSIDEIDLF